MATISSHVLDSVIGNHADGIQVQCYRIKSATERTLLFDVKASVEGRIAEEINLPDSSSVEVVFQSEAYFLSSGMTDNAMQIMPQIVVRLALPDANAKYHLPIMLSPHSYSIWWSGQ